MTCLPNQIVIYTEVQAEGISIIKGALLSPVAAASLSSMLDVMNPATPPGAETGIGAVLGTVVAVKMTRQTLSQIRKILNTLKTGKFELVVEPELSGVANYSALGKYDEALSTLDRADDGKENRLIPPEWKPMAEHLAMQKFPNEGYGSRVKEAYRFVREKVKQRTQNLFRTGFLPTEQC